MRIYLKIGEVVNILFLAAACFACGGGSSDGGGGGAILANAKGALKSQSGDSSENAGWVVVFVERDSRVARAGIVQPNGDYEIRGLPLHVPQTVVLLDSRYVLQSVLTSPGTETGQVHQFFRLKSESIPNLVSYGSVVKFGDVDTSVLEFEADFAIDSDIDDIPEEMETATISPDSGAAGGAAAEAPATEAPATEAPAAETAVLGLQALDEVDQDSDTIPNNSDADIDNLGIINAFDLDMDNDGVQNIFDSNSDGNESEDALQSGGVLYYSDGINFFNVQVIEDSDADSVGTYLLFTAKLAPGENPDLVAIRGPETLLGQAQSVIVDPNTGLQAIASWDFTLADDGLNGDGEADDGLFARKVLLGPAAVILGRQTVFLQLQYGKTQKEARFKEYPHMFAAVTTSPVTGSATGLRFTMTGVNNAAAFTNTRVEEFAVDPTYVWSVVLFERDTDTMAKVFSSDPNVADASSGTWSFSVPAGVIASGNYTGNILVQAQSSIPGYPRWTIRSADFNVTIPP